MSIVLARGPLTMYLLIMTTTAALLETLAADDMEAFEALTAGELRVRITAKRSEKIEAVCTWAWAELDADKAQAWESLCRLAREGLSRWVDVVLAKESKLVAAGYQW